MRGREERGSEGEIRREEVRGERQGGRGGGGGV